MNISQPAIGTDVHDVEEHYIAQINSMIESGRDDLVDGLVRDGLRSELPRGYQVPRAA
jgi:hypothetical protein